MEVWIVLIIACCGSFFQCVTGFGYAIICMAVWPVFFTFAEAAVLEVITAFILVTYLTVKLRKHINFKILVVPLLAANLFSGYGVKLMTQTNDYLMGKIIGILLFCLVGYFLLFSKKIKIQANWKNGLVVGGISGFLGGLVNIGGPLMAVYYLDVTEDKKTYNGTLQCFFCLNTLAIFMNHLLIGNLTIKLINLSGIATISLIVGTSLGLYFFEKISNKGIEKIVYVCMLIFGIYFLIR